MITETQRRRSLALGKVAVELQLTAQGYPCPRPFGLASLGVTDRLRKPEEIHSPGGWHKEDAIVIAQDQVLPTQRHEITDAGFVESSAVVDHQHVARCGSLERLQENVDTADMLSGSHPPSQATAWHHRAQ
jgi:hypothetical protein